MGSGYRTFVSGEILTAANLQGYLADQAVMVFADATARDAAVTSPADGMICYLEDTGYYQAYESSTWNNLITSSGAVALAASATALATGRTISLTGDATGTSGSFDGTGNVSIATTLPNAADMSGSDYAGRKITVTATEPTSPTTGDLWIDIST
jgi:hypothetical protein